MEETARFLIPLIESRFWMVFSFVLVGFLFFIWFSYFRSRFEKKLNQLTQEIDELHQEVAKYQKRDHSNLKMMRTVVDGFDGIVQSMKESLEEEESKLKIVQPKKEVEVEASPLLGNKERES